MTGAPRFDAVLSHHNGITEFFHDAENAFDRACEKAGGGDRCQAHENCDGKSITSQDACKKAVTGKEITCEEIARKDRVKEAEARKIQTGKDKISDTQSRGSRA